MSRALSNDGVRNLLSSDSKADDRFRAIFNAVNDGIFISDPDTGQFVEINEAGCRMFGYDKTEIIGLGVDTLSSGVHPYTQDMAVELNEKARLGEPQIFEWRCKTKDGVLFWTEMSLRHSEFGHGPAVIAVIRDISERKRLDAEVVYMAQHDMLTGLANRSMFTSALDNAIAQSIRTGGSFSVLSLDLDHFKDVNDTRGHLTGDRLLRLVAARLQSGVRPNEIVARFGGDEFAILLGDLREPTEIAALAQRLIASIGKPFLIDGNEIHIGTSIGVAICSDDACDVETLLSQADVALYRAKAEGRQIYQFFSEAMNEEVRARVVLTDELRLAIPAGQLFLVYQPQVSATSGRVIGVEALVRWRHPRRGVLLPKDFLPAAERSGLIGALGHWVLREACRQGREWLEAGNAPGTISVNISSADFKVPRQLEKTVLAILAETGLPPSMLELEITETTLIDLSSQHGEMIQRMRRAGIRFSLDDFGTGHSSLSYLRRFPIDRIKIAQEFISDLTTSKESASIVKLVVGLAHELANDVIAEGVETSEQLRLLQLWNCRDVQGYYFAHPMSAEAIGPLVKTGTIEPFSTHAAFVA